MAKPSSIHSARDSPPSCGDRWRRSRSVSPRLSAAVRRVSSSLALAPTVIANARAHGDERQARADLETLVQTSSVGVVVFDGGTGELLSFNRELAGDGQ